MSIKARLDMESGKGKFISVVICDRCGKELRDSTDHVNIKAVMKQAEWKTVKAYSHGTWSGWEDYCVECWAEEYEELGVTTHER